MAATHNLRNKYLPETVSLTIGSAIDFSDITAFDWQESASNSAHRASGFLYAFDGGVSSVDVSLNFSTRDKKATTVKVGDKVTAIAATCKKLGAGTTDIVIGLASNCFAAIKDISCADDGGAKQWTISMDCFSSNSSDIFPLKWTS